ncbi:hypothetical protein DLD77_00860 [Chitinophaga alhagiae]|uniref:Uncharacterized protein n=1 Tax=Chitinophaga alhagiae TaxID=2203219 RepID=A0ABN5LW30_9BACT|nr:hypothetical protein [Chitinophaga alhagiae]AWO00357.1 hypothetical protein DLD77_00860 [Chitinophaga alhagiae]
METSIAAKHAMMRTVTPIKHTMMETITTPLRKPVHHRTTAIPLIDMNTPAAMAMVTRTVHQHPVLIQLPTVFALMAAPTAEGARQLDNCKMRLEGKNYGTAIGSLQHFLAQARPGALPCDFHTAEQFRNMEGAFIRLQFRHRHFQSAVIRNGQHQGLLLNGPFRRLFMQVERSFDHYPQDAIWGGNNYTALLITSCNISGHPGGSITSLNGAVAFARERGIPFIVTTQQTAEEKGSYPVLGFEREAVRVHREGPGLARFLQQIPAGLKNW